MEGDLFRFGEVVLRVAVQGEQADRAHRGELFGHELRRVEQVDAFEGLVLGVGHDLQTQLPLRAVAAFDGVGEVASVEVGVEAVDQLGLFPQQRVDAVLGFPMELHQGRLAGGVLQTEGVDPEAFHHPERAGDRSVRHLPHRVVCGFSVQGHEVPESVVGALGLGDLSVRVRFGRMDDVGELQRILDEEDREVVAHEVEDAVGGVELRREPTRVACDVGRSAGADDRGEAGEDFGHGVLLQERGLRHRLGGPVGAEDPVCGGSSGMDDAFGDPLMIEMSDLLPQMVVLQQDRAPRSGLQRVIRIGQPSALSGGVVFALLAPARAIVVAQPARRGRRLRSALVRFRFGRWLWGVGLVDVRRLCSGLARNDRGIG